MWGIVQSGEEDQGQEKWGRAESCDEWQESRIIAMPDKFHPCGTV